MNTIKKIILLLMLAALVPFKVQSQDYEQHYHPVTLECNPVAATIAVFIDGVEQQRTDLELGAFIDGICRGSAFFIPSPPVFPGHSFAMPSIHGRDGEVVCFRLYDHTAGRELDMDCLTTNVFRDGDKWGDFKSAFNVYFETSGNTFLLVTDAGMLVGGRQFLIGNINDGEGKLLGGQDVAGRVAVGAIIDNHKTEQEVATIPSASGVPFLFTLENNGGVWYFFDEANDSYLSVNASGNIVLNDTPADWNVELDPSGGVKVSIVVEGTTYYLFYDVESGVFSCSTDQHKLYLFEKCKPIEGGWEALNMTDASRMYLVESGTALEVSDLSTVNPFNLIVEDGAQLITNSAAQVTIQKNILAYVDADERDGWYTLASPVAGEIESASNMTSNDFDLFYFRETVVTKEWRNYKNPENEFVNFESGRGYLYANSEDITLNFKGTLNTEAATYAMTYTDSRPDDLKGFALVGNPFAHNIKKGSGCAIDDARLATGYYTLTHSGAWETHTDDEMIFPGRGILIQTSEAGDLTINNVVASQTRGKSSHNAYLALEVEGKQGSDKAFAYFGEGIGLNKIAHFGNAPMLYLRQNAKDYAIAHYAVDEMVGEIPVFFQASENDKYVISVANDGLCFDYLHLVDNLTGEDLDLMDSDRNASVTYIFTAQTSDYTSRFKLVYQLHHDIEDMAADFCYFANGRLVIPSIEGETALQIIDLSGRIVSSQMVNGSYNQPLNLNAGVYVVRMGDKTQKIVVF